MGRVCKGLWDGDLRELLAEVQGETWLRFVEPNHEGYACLAKQFRFYSEGNGEPVQNFKPKKRHYPMCSVCILERSLGLRRREALERETGA